MRAFAGYLTIGEYVGTCEVPTLPRIYMRIDVPHFIKTYLDLLKIVRSKLVRVFYKAAIGLLTNVRDPETA